MFVVMSPLYPEAVVRLEIFVGGVTFLDGSLNKNLTAADFDDLGVAKVTFLQAPGSNTSTCHSLQVLQDGVLVGVR